MRDNLDTLDRTVVVALGGPTEAGRLVSRNKRTIRQYVIGERPVPPDVAEMLADKTAALATALIAASHDLRRIAKAGHQRRARIRLASRERYFQRFDRYPMPARGDPPKQL